MKYVCVWLYFFSTLLICSCDNYKDANFTDLEPQFQVIKSHNGSPYLKFSFAKKKNKQGVLILENISGKPILADTKYKIVVYNGSQKTAENVRYNFIGVIANDLPTALSITIEVGEAFSTITNADFIEVALLAVDGNDNAFKGGYENEFKAYDKMDTLVFINKCHGVIEADGSVNLKLTGYGTDSLKIISGVIGSDSILRGYAFKQNNKLIAPVKSKSKLLLVDNKLTATLQIDTTNNKPLIRKIDIILYR